MKYQEIFTSQLHTEIGNVPHGGGKGRLGNCRAKFETRCCVRTKQAAVGLPFQEASVESVADNAEHRVEVLCVALKGGS